MWFPLACHSRFIPASQIDDVFLYEGFKRWEVRYYLAVVVHGEEKVEVVFPVYHLFTFNSNEAETFAEAGCVGAGLADSKRGVIQGG